MWLNKTLKQALVLGLGVFGAVAAHAELHVSDAWVRGTVSQQRASAAFMQLHSTESLRLVGVTSNVATTAEVHEMALEGDVMKMKAVQGLDLPAGKAVALTPGGYHIMLMGLKAPLEVGQTVHLELKLQKVPGGEMVVQQVVAPVRPLAGKPAAKAHAHDQGHAHHEHADHNHADHKH